MLITLQYSADLEEVPQEVSKLINDVLDKEEITVSELYHISSFLKHYNGNDVSEQITKIQQIVKRNLRGLARLEDVIAILQGYQQVKNVPQQPQEPLTPPETNKVDKEEFSDS